MRLFSHDEAQLSNIISRLYQNSDPCPTVHPIRDKLQRVRMSSINLHLGPNLLTRASNAGRTYPKVYYPVPGVRLVNHKISFLWKIDR